MLRNLAGLMVGLLLTSSAQRAEAYDGKSYYDDLGYYYLYYGSYYAYYANAYEPSNSYTAAGSYAAYYACLYASYSYNADFYTDATSEANSISYAATSVSYAYSGYYYEYYAYTTATNSTAKTLAYWSMQLCYYGMIDMYYKSQGY